MSFSHLISKIIFTVGIIFAFMQVNSCATQLSEEEADIMNGTISFPFVSQSQPLGKNEAEERFVIKSAVGNTEYTVEIPGAAKDYDIQIPLADIDSGNTGEAGVIAKPKELSNPSSADHELVSDLPQLEKKHPSDTALMDSAFGVGSKGGPGQGPSYLLGIAKINQLYKNRQFEYALVEINNLLAFYPTSPKLHKMKGTVLIKLGNVELAEKSWVKASQLSPKDLALRKGLERLQRKMAASRPTASALDQGLAPPPVIDAPPVAH